ncbi:MAG: SDR family oxidoreductase [Desulfobacteraceae bacterium]|nr:SDR family oxidoreductase [Desulfobacteraceae bacterium]
MAGSKNIQKTEKPVLVTGATGYVAGRLIPLLLDSGYRVRTMGRSLEKMAARPWAGHPRLEPVRGDIMDVASLKEAVRGCGTIYYLVHSMISRKERYRHADRTGARNMARAAAVEKADHIIYLGGLGDMGHKNISKHLVSRNEVGEILKQGSVPVTVLRAAMILGSGSASFEILRYLVERLPLMITPKWISMQTQPIAITNVLGYLKGCLEHPETREKTFDIGGPDIITYRDLFQLFAATAGLPRPRLIPLLVLTPRMSALWINQVTPVPAAIAKPLAEGLSLPTLCTENSITRIIPQQLINCSQAIQRALAPIREQGIDPCRTATGTLTYPESPHCGDSDYSGGTILKCGFRAQAKGRPPDLATAFGRLNQKNGHHVRLRRIRRVWDMVTGGAGLKRKKEKDPDFWRIIKNEPPSGLWLADETQMPGRGLLEIEITRPGNNQCQLSILYSFFPRGLLGIVYWYLLYPFHHRLLTHILKEIVRTADLKLVSTLEKFPPKQSQSADKR